MCETGVAIGEHDEGLCEVTCSIDRAVSASVSQPCIPSSLCASAREMFACVLALGVISNCF